jgi:hypothetical protein
LTTKEISIFSNSSHFEWRAGLLTFKSSLKLLNQIKANLAGWVPFKIVSNSPALHSRWLLLLKIEISSIQDLSIDYYQ